MDLFTRNVQRLNELSPNCKDRALTFHEKAFPLQNFTVAEVYRSPERQLALYTQGRTLEQVKRLYENKVLSNANFEALRCIYEAGKNLQGRIVTWTLRSIHTDRRAFDVRILGVDPKTERVGLNLLDKYGAQFGIYRPIETMAMGDYCHFQAYDWPMVKQDQSWLRQMINLRIEAKLRNVS
jgi:hypothetical protein